MCHGSIRLQPLTRFLFVSSSSRLKTLVRSSPWSPYSKCLSDCSAFLIRTLFRESNSQNINAKRHNKRASGGLADARFESGLKLAKYVVRVRDDRII